MHRINYAAIFFLATVLLPNLSIAQEMPDAKQLQKSFVRTAKLYAITKNSKPLRLEPTPILNWTNPERFSEQGAVFVWYEGKQPAAVGTFFTYVYDGQLRAKHELQSVASGPLRATFNGKLAWTPAQAGVQWTKIDVGRPPGASRPANLAQMRSIARQFMAKMTDPEGEITDLRLLPRPLIRYASEEEGIPDGSVFSFAVATDPEALLLIRAVDDGTGPVWQYAFARFNNFRLEAFLGQKRVWSVAYDQGMMMNRLGDQEHFKKTYNSFHPETDLRYQPYEK